MPPEDVPKRGLSHKLMKKRKEPRRMSVEIPDRLKDGDDAEDDVTAPKKKGGINMNKSIFGMIIEAGKSKTEVHRRFDDGPSESEGDAGEDQDSRVPKTPSSIAVTSTEERNLLWKTSSQKKASDHKLFKSLPRLHLHTHRGKRQAPVTDPMSASQILPPKPSRSSVDPNHVGALGYNNSIENEESVAQAGEQPEFGDLELATHEGGSDSALVVPRVKTSMGLSDTLMEIFQFDELEEVVSTYPCWLLNSVLLQGYLYITQKHICFYSYLPKKNNVVLKSGNLWKRGRQNPRYHRYWFTLRGDVLTYYENPAEPYFRRGDVDLRYGISASLAESKDKAIESTGFTVTTQEQTYHFKADSAASAKEWVKQIQKVIFRSHNDGDSVKICLPIDNVIEIEESPVIDFADTVKVKVYQDETYAVDEYHFSFFSFAQDAMNVLKIMIDGNAAQARSANESLIPGPDSGFHTPTYKSRPHSVSREQSLHRGSDDGTPSIRENVRATLSPLSVSGRTSPRRSSEFVRSSFERSRHSLDVPRESGRSSFDRGRRSIDATSRRSPNESRRVSKSPLSPKPQDSSESAQSSTDRDTALAAAIESMDDMHASASQILTRSDVFHAPTLKHSQSHRTSATTTTGKPQEQLQNTLHSLSNDIMRTQPSARSSTEPTIHRHKLGMLHQAVNDSDEGSDLQLQKMQQSDSSSALGGLMRAGAYPLQRASGFAGFLKSRSKRMSTMLATESMGYFEKVSGMWAGGKRHYGDAEGLAPLDQVHDPDDDEDDEKHGRRFRTHFALPESEQLLATYFCYLHRVLPLYGKIYISNRTFCFRSLLYGTKTKLVVPLKDIYNVDKEKGFRFGYSGMVVVIRGHEEIFFEFGHADVRDDCAITLLQRLEAVQHIQEPGLMTEGEKQDAQEAEAEHQLLQEARQDGYAEHQLQLPKSFHQTEADAPPILFDDARASIINFTPDKPLRITCLTIGSRGDVQPYIALCKGLLKEGHKPKIATHAEFEPWIRKHGIDFAPVEGDPAELMRICVENGMFTYSFLKEANAKFSGWIDELLSSGWAACQNSDLLIESPSAMAGIHIAEALQIPYFRAFSMPWTRTRAYPHAFAIQAHKMGGFYNYMSYVTFDTVFWKFTASQVNRWRRKELGLPSTNLDKMQPNKVPFLYNFSPSVVVPPLDFSDWIRVTGYWFLDEATGWQPPKELTDFIAKAREDKKKLVYVGFGSIVVEDPAALTKTVISAVLKADIRCILSKGWSDRLDKKHASKTEHPLPAEIHQISSAPHDWLFTQIDAAVHHGGAGTTGASLRAGLPTIIKPFFGDQFFFGSRVEDLGAGIHLKKINVSELARAMWIATNDQRMIIKARILGEQIRTEDGVGNAIKAIYRDMDYAKTLIKRHDRHSADQDDDIEESWTFLDSDDHSELHTSVTDWHPMAREPTGLTDRRSSRQQGVSGAALGSMVLKRGSGVLS